MSMVIYFRLRPEQVKKALEELELPASAEVSTFNPGHESNVDPRTVEQVSDLPCDRGGRIRLALRTRSWSFSQQETLYSYLQDAPTFSIPLAEMQRMQAHIVLPAK